MILVAGLGLSAFANSGTQEVAHRPVLPGTQDTNFFPGYFGFHGARVLAVDETDKIIVGGELWFGDVPPGGWLTRIGKDGEADPSFQSWREYGGPLGPVFGLARQNDGKIVINGWNGGIGRINADGSPDNSFNRVSTDATVWSIAAQTNSKILIAGDFSSVNGEACFGIARLQTNGTLGSGFVGPFTSNTHIRAIALQEDQKILVAGFLALGSNTISKVVRLNPNGLLDTTFNPHLEFDTWIHCLTRQPDGRVLVGGSFSTVNGQRARGLVRLNLDGSVDLSFQDESVTNAIVNALAVQSDGKIVAGGSFWLLNEVDLPSIVRFQPDGQLDPLFVAPETQVRQLGLQSDGKIIVAHDWSLMRLFSGDPAPFAPIILTQPPVSQTADPGTTVRVRTTVKALPTATVQWYRNDIPVTGATSEDLQLGNVRASQQGAYRFVATNVYGSVTSAVSQLHVRAESNHAGALDLDFYTGSGPGSEPDDVISSVALQPDGKVIIAGWFNSVDGSEHHGIARLNRDGSVDETFHGAAADADGHGCAYAVALLPDDNMIIAPCGALFGPTSPPPIMRLNSSGNVDPSFEPALHPGDRVARIVVQPNGRMLLAGVFSDSSGRRRAGVKRLNADGTADASFNFNVDVGPHTDDMEISTLIVQPDGKILVGGEFDSVDEVSRHRIARLNADGSLDASFDPGSGADASVHVVSLQPDGKVLVGGRFMRFNGVLQPKLARLNADGSLDRGFLPDILFSLDAGVYSIVVQANGKIVFGGAFTGVNGNYAGRNIARVHSDGSLDLNFAAKVFDTVTHVFLQGDGNFLIAGRFLADSFLPRTRIARLFGGEPPEFRAVIWRQFAGGPVRQGSEAVFRVGGDGWPSPFFQWHFNGRDIPGATNRVLSVPNVRTTDAGIYTVTVSNGLGSETSREARLEVEAYEPVAGSADLSFYSGAGPNGPVHAIAVQGDRRILVGGAFTQVGGIRRNHVARLLGDGSVDPTFDSQAGANSLVHALVWLPGGKVIIAGDFTKYGAERRSRIARLHPDGTLDLEFDPGSGPNGHITDVALQADGKLVIAGNFSNIAGTPRKYIARLNRNGAVDASFDPGTGPDARVFALAVQPDGKILIAGEFRSVNGVPRNFIARLSISGAVGTAFDPDVNSQIDVLALQLDGKIIISGIFTTVNGVPRENLARLNPDGTTDLTFGTGRPAGETIFSMALDDGGKLFVGGNFESLYGSTAFRIGRLHADGTLDFSFRPLFGVQPGIFDIEALRGAAVLSLALDSDHTVVIGGHFAEVTGMRRPYLARLFTADSSPFVGIGRVNLDGRPGLQLRWRSGVVQTATNMLGPWRDTEVPSPYQFLPTNSQQYFRLKVPSP